MRSSFFPHSSQNSQTLNQRKNNTLTFQGSGTESPKRKYLFEEFMDSIPVQPYPTIHSAPYEDSFLITDDDNYDEHSYLRDALGAEHDHILPAANKHWTVLSSPKSDSGPPKELNILPAKQHPPQSPKNELSQLLPDLSLAEIPDQGNSVDTNTGISPFALHQFNGQISDRTRHTLFSFLDEETPESQPLQTQKTKAVKESPTKAAPKAFTNPDAKWGQLTPQEKATLLTFMAHPRHYRCQEETIQAFLRQQYGFQVSKSAISRCQSFLSENDANNIWWNFAFDKKWQKLPDRWNSKVEETQAKENHQILLAILEQKGLSGTPSLIQYEGQPIIPRNTDSVFEDETQTPSFKPEQNIGDDKTRKSSSPRLSISSGSQSPRKRKAADSIALPNPFQVEVPQSRKAGRKRNPEEQAKILDAIAKDTSITPNQLIHRGLLATRSSTNTYIGLMQYFNNDKKEVLDLLSKIPRGGTLPKAKQIEVLNYIASHRNANTYEVMAECKVGHDTVEGFKKHLEACGGNLQTALSTEPAKKRQKK